MIVIYLTVQVSCWLHDALCNIGYSGFTAVIIACLTDVANTAMERKRNCNTYNRLIKSLENACDNLPCEFLVNIHQYRRNEKHILDAKYSFQEWMELLFEPCCSPNNATDQMCEIECCVNEIQRIANLAENFLHISQVYCDNPCFTQENESKVSQLRSSCNHVIRAYNSKNLGSCKKLIIEDLKKSIINLFPNQKNQYSKKYNMDDFC